MNRDDQLLELMVRRNWYILALLVLISLFWRSVEVTQGVLAGGLLAILAYGWLYRSLVKALSGPEQVAARGFQRTYFLRLAALAAAIFLLIAKGGVHPVALSAGLSVVIVNILWTTFRRML
ncbi:MAG TPA: ATP synthase subunit I [Malonomonas sp.]